MLSELDSKYPAGRLYFPFGFSDKRELRAQQTYFVKMPREVLEVLSLDDLEGDLAVKAYEDLGYQVEYSGSSKPYDLVASSTEEDRRVEVRGSSGHARHVELTDGEVRNSRDWRPRTCTSSMASNGGGKPTAQCERAPATFAGGRTGMQRILA